jgi:hypothetical protein
MAWTGFNPAVVGGPNIPPGSVTAAMMPSGYLLIDQVGSDGWAVQLNTPTPTYSKPQPSDVQTKPTPVDIATTSPSVPAPVRDLRLRRS